MSTNGKSSKIGGRDDEGFTLVEILIAIVLVGILSTVAVVGISSLTSKGSKSACTASHDASKAAATVYYADQSAYPTTFTDMTSIDALTLPTDAKVSEDGLTVTGSGWTLVMSGKGDTMPTFTCS